MSSLVDRGGASPADCLSHCLADKVNKRRGAWRVCLEGIQTPADTSKGKETHELRPGLWPKTAFRTTSKCLVGLAEPTGTTVLPRCLAGVMLVPMRTDLKVYTRMDLSCGLNHSWTVTYIENWTCGHWAPSQARAQQAPSGTSPDHPRLQIAFRDIPAPPRPRHHTRSSPHPPQILPRYSN